MYKLLIVDDEEIEREGIAQLIPWGKYGIRLTGTAWNGQDALAQMAADTPDIVLTDIKMPVMDGIELIRKCRYEYPDVVFVVLSGHGEYECTSQAMAEGVRYYVLKPCGEEEIMSILEQVKLKISELRCREEQAVQYHSKLSRAIPRAREQLFRNVLLGCEHPEDDSLLFSHGLEDKGDLFCVLTIRKETPFDYVQQQLIYNAFCDIYENKLVPVATAIHQDVLLLLNHTVAAGLDRVLRFLRREWLEEGLSYLQAAISEPRPLNALYALYDEIQELFQVGRGLDADVLLSRQLFRETEDVERLVNAKKLAETQELGDLLGCLYSIFLKMELDRFSPKDKLQAYKWILRVLCGTTPQTEELPDSPDHWTLFVWLADELARQNPHISTDAEDYRQMRSILLAFYGHIQNPNFNLRYLSREVLFMNEDYLGKLFARKIKMKFSDYLLRQRICLAKDLLAYRPSLRISQLATMVGYAPDGQYFSKAFRKATGMSPKSYQDSLKKGGTPQ